MFSSRKGYCTQISDPSTLWVGLPSCLKCKKDCKIGKDMADFPYFVQNHLQLKIKYQVYFKNACKFVTLVLNDYHYHDFIIK